MYILVLGFQLIIPRGIEIWNIRHNITYYAYTEYLPKDYFTALDSEVYNMNDMNNAYYIV